MLEKPAQSVPALPGDLRLRAASAAGEEHSHRGAKSRTCPGTGLTGPGNTSACGTNGTGTVQDPGSGPIPVLQSQREAESLWHRMALGRGAASGCGARGVCMATQTVLCKAAAGHRQLVLQLGGSADGPQLREERHRRSVEVRELSVGLQSALLAWLRQAVGPQERRELERLWVLFLSALELFLQDLCCAHHLCSIFSPGGGGVTPLRTGLGGWRGGGPELPPAPPCLEEEMEQVRAMLVEMESTANIPLWTVESMHVVGSGEGTAPVSHMPGPGTGSCCRVL